MVGPYGGLLLSPRDLVEEHNEALRHLRGALVRRKEVASSRAEYARLLATTWEIPISRESGRYSFVLPEEPRKLRIVPSEGEIVAVFGCGEILEAWPADAWIAHVRSLFARSQSLLEDIRETID